VGTARPSSAPRYFTSITVARCMTSPVGRCATSSSAYVPGGRPVNLITALQSPALFTDFAGVTRTGMDETVVSPRFRWNSTLT
jgi:hypothetical protein